MLTLYRGDYNRIKKFEYHKTNKYCLLGQGIYLTDELELADTYRTKGSNSRVASPELYYGSAEDRTDALNKAFVPFCKEMWRKQFGSKMKFPTDAKAIDKYKASQREIYQMLYASGAITAEYTTAPVSVYRFSHQQASAKISRMKEATKQHIKTLVVKYADIDKVGYITVFNFPRKLLEANIINVDKPIYDESFWSIMHENKVAIGTPYDNHDFYVRSNKGTKVTDVYNCRKINQYKRLQEVLRPYGIFGFEYAGGTRVGGGGKHRAFCLWDEEFVNDHKVRMTT